MDKLNVYIKPNDFISLNYNCGLVKDSHPLKVMRNVSNVWSKTINHCPNGYCCANNQKLGKTLETVRQRLLSLNCQRFLSGAAQCGQLQFMHSCLFHKILCCYYLVLKKIWIHLNEKETVRNIFTYVRQNVLKRKFDILHIKFLLVEKSIKFWKWQNMQNGKTCKILTKTFLIYFNM